MRLPAGYRICDVRPEEEAELVNSLWPHAQDGEREQTRYGRGRGLWGRSQGRGRGFCRAKLERLPSACVRDAATDEPVGFVMSDPAGRFSLSFWPPVLLRSPPRR